MPLTIKQAHAVNVVLEWLLDPAQPGLNDDVVFAAALLADAAHDRLGAGLRSYDVATRAQELPV